MKFTVITLFPEIITAYCQESILGRAQKLGAMLVHAVQLRDFAEDKHKTVDDTPYGGGAGMVLRGDVIYKALEAHDVLSKKSHPQSAVQKIVGSIATQLHIKKLRRVHTVLLSPRGRMFTQQVAREFAEKYDEIAFVCGRYEGVDQRVAEYMVDEELSVGEYVLAGGELPALTVIEAVSRLLPGVLGNSASLNEETFGGKEDNTHADTKEYPQYTRPPELNGCKVPDILLSGDHKKIAEWRSNIH